MRFLALATGGAYLAQSNYFDLAEEDFDKKKLAGDKYKRWTIGLVVTS